MRQEKWKEIKGGEKQGVEEIGGTQGEEDDRSRKNERELYQ